MSLRNQVHAGGLEAFQRGRGAPWPLRIAYETLIDVPAAARNGGIARLEYPLRGDGDATLQAMLYPEGRLNLSRDWRRFLAALADIVALGYPPERGLSASALSMRKARVLEDMAAFEAEGLIVFEAHPDGRRWRVLPPDTDPA